MKSAKHAASLHVKFVVILGFFDTLKEPPRPLRVNAM